MIAAIEVSESLQKGFDSFFNFLPNLLAFLVILVVGFFIAKLIQGIITKVLQKLGLDKQLHDSQAGQYVERITPGASPSKGIGKVVFYLIFLFVLTAAIGALKIPAVTAFMNQVLGYLPNVIAAIVIFVVAAALAGAAGAAVAKLMGDTPTGKLVGSVVPTLILVIGIFMVLNQLQIAEEIVTITFGVILGSVGLGMALAFGLGGRAVAADMLDTAYRRGREKKEDAKRDLETGKDRAQTQVQERAPGGGPGGSGGGGLGGSGGSGGGGLGGSGGSGGGGLGGSGGSGGSEPGGGSYRAS
jgi:Conserved TM helix